MVTVHRKALFCTIYNGVRFLPGMNTLSDGEFDAVKESKGFKSELECGNMIMGSTITSETSDAVEVTNNPKARSLKIASEIQSMELSVAIDTISKSNDGGLLKAVLSVDGRKGIQEAVQKRLQDINAQIGDNLTPVSKSAPEGDGSDFPAKVTGTKEELEGGKSFTAIPALKKGK